MSEVNLDVIDMNVNEFGFWEWLEKNGISWEIVGVGGGGNDDVKFVGEKEKLEKMIDEWFVGGDEEFLKSLIK